MGSKHQLTEPAEETFESSAKHQSTVPTVGPPKSLFLALLAFRLLNSLAVQTYFNPDEFWQGPEVAHRMVFGYGYLTWEWQPEWAARSFLHPLLFAAGYRLLALLRCDTPWLVRHSPRFMQAAMATLADVRLYALTHRLFPFAPRVSPLPLQRHSPRFMQAAMAALADLRLYALTRRLFPSHPSAAAWAKGFEMSQNPSSITMLSFPFPHAPLTPSHPSTPLVCPLPPPSARLQPGLLVPPLLIHTHLLQLMLSFPTCTPTPSHPPPLAPLLVPPSARLQSHLLCNLTCWSLFFCATRTFSNSLEASLAVIALSYWPWRHCQGDTEGAQDTGEGTQGRTEAAKGRGAEQGRGGGQLSATAQVSDLRGANRPLALALAAAACMVRPTSTPFWLPLGLHELALLLLEGTLKGGSDSSRGRWEWVRLLLLEVLPIGLIAVAITVAVDSWQYGQPMVFTPLNLLRFNVHLKGSSLHSSQPCKAHSHPSPSRVFILALSLDPYRTLLHPSAPLLIPSFLFPRPSSSPTLLIPHHGNERHLLRTHMHFNLVIIFSPGSLYTHLHPSAPRLISQGLIAMHGTFFPLACLGLLWCSFFHPSAPSDSPPRYTHLHHLHHLLQHLQQGLVWWSVRLPFLLALWLPLFYSLSDHKEHRFILLSLPLLNTYAALALSLLNEEREREHSRLATTCNNCNTSNTKPHTPGQSPPLHQASNSLKPPEPSQLPNPSQRSTSSRSGPADQSWRAFLSPFLHPQSPLFRLLLTAAFLPQLLAALYLSTSHQRGTISVMPFLEGEIHGILHTHSTPSRDVGRGGGIEGEGGGNEGGEGVREGRVESLVLPLPHSCPSSRLLDSLPLPHFQHCCCTHYAHMRPHHLM
ncbi:unnamed protein product [Closterium sp. NIES-65]|nr:unnamed protein product [Closterium sp. NIES-65]